MDRIGGHVMKPLIGITASMTWEKERDAFSGYKRNYLSFDYVEAVIAGGGVPIIIPVCADFSVLTDIVQRLDGLLLSGGSDISPVMTGEEPSAGLGLTLLERDRSEWRILDAAMAEKLPILGICRGFQVLNCYFGGTLYQDLGEAEHLVIKHDFNGLPGDPAHSLDFSEGSLIQELMGGHDWVNSHHHQVLRDIAPVFTVTARARDGAPEAIEADLDGQFILGVQFHPEMMFRQHEYVRPIFDRFIEEAARPRK